MTTLVLGGNGLIGAYTVASLVAAGRPVAVFSRTPPGFLLRPLAGRFTWIKGDVTDAHGVADAVARSGAKRIAHLAALLQFGCDNDPRQATEVNVGGTVNVLEAARLFGVERVVFASSSAAYGIRSDRLLEDAPISADISLYGMTKLMGERLGTRYGEVHGLGFVALRYSAVFGPGEVKSPGMAKVLKDIESTIDGRDVTITDVAGELERSLCYVKDAAAATVLALDHPKPTHRLYNVGGPDGNYAPLRAFHEAIRRAAPGAGRVTFTGRGRQAGLVDTSRIRTDLGFAPRFDIAAGVGDLLAEQARLGQG